MNVRAFGCVTISKRGFTPNAMGVATGALQQILICGFHYEK